MDIKSRVQEAIKQTQLAEQEVENSKVSQQLEDGLESLQNGLESLEKEGEN